MMRSRSRRIRSRLAMAVSLLLIGAASPPATHNDRLAPSAPRPDSRPNILFVLVDDMGFGDLSVMGNRKVATPYLDRLAREGVLLTHFYDAAPICSSSRAGFMTGRFPAELGFVGITASRERNALTGQANWLDPKVPTLASVLARAGYSTAHIGKWHLGGGRDVGDAPWPTAYGFDQSFTTFEGLGPRVLVSDEERDLAEQSDRLGGGARFWELKTNLTRLYCDMAVDYVVQHAASGRPWFVNLWLNDVHDPWAPDSDSLSDTTGKGADADDDRYLATLVKMDRTLGRMLARLDQMGQLDNTLVVVTSDNGPSSLQRYYQKGATAPGSTAMLRGRKFSLYEGGIRQPLILYWRGHVAAGTRDERTIGQGVDLLPTLAHVADTGVPAGVQGVDLSPVLKGHPVDRRAPLYWAYGKERAPEQPNLPFQPHDRSPRFAIRNGNWKLLADADAKNVQLYDMATDPLEAHDVAAERPKVAASLLASLRGWMERLPRYAGPLRTQDASRVAPIRD